MSHPINPDTARADPPIRLALFDIDGTLLDQHGHYSDDLRDQIRRIQNLGVKTAIASGRPHFAAKFLMDDLALLDPGVFCTGAHIYDPRHQLTRSAQHLTFTEVQALLTCLRQSSLYYEAYGEALYFYETEFAAEIRLSHAQHLRSQPLAADLLQLARQQPLLKFLVGGEGDHGLQQLQALEQNFPQLTFAYAHFPAHPSWHFASVISAKACKHQAFRWLLEHYQVEPEQVVSFGDSQSDMVFLSLAGHGVAMGNAAGKVKSVARWVCPPAWNNGVAETLKRLI